MIEVQSIAPSYRNCVDFSNTTTNEQAPTEINKIGPMRTEFGNRLYEARKYARLTQEQAATAIGMTQSNYSALERSGQGSSYVPAIAKLCGVSVLWLAYGEGEMLSSGRDAEKDPQPTYGNLSHQALEVAALFDLIPIRDRVKRALAYNLATSAILSIVQGDKPTH